MPSFSDETLANFRTSPYFTAFEGKTPEQAAGLEVLIDLLPEKTKDFLFDPTTSTAIRRIVAMEELSETYGTALAKIVFAVLMEEVPLNSIVTLLKKLDLSPEQAKRVADATTKLLEPVVSAKAKTTVGATPREIPPLTLVVPPSATSPQGAERNIIDLRKAEQQTGKPPRQ